MIQDQTSLLKYLFDQGHFHEKDEDGFVTIPRPWGDVHELPVDHKDMQDAVASWQSYRPLKVDGHFGDVCAMVQVQEEGLRCRCPDVMERRAKLSEWPEACQREITTAHMLNGLTFEDSSRTIENAWDYAIGRWNLVSGIVLNRANWNEAKIRATANRESSGILAWSYLPNNNCAERLTQSYNNRVRWRWLLLWATICHEIGHAIGLSHGGRGIMQPAHDSTVNELGSWDIAQAVKRYGPAITPPPIPVPEPPTPPPPANGEYGMLEWFMDGLSVGKYDVLPRAEVP